MVGFCILLHTHMPYVRRNGDWPCGEQWVLETWAECYLPIWDLMDNLAEGRTRGKLALTLTPILAEQLEDPYLQDRFSGYLRNRIRQAGQEIERLDGMGDRARARIAAAYRGQLQELLDRYEEKWRGGMTEALRRFVQSGKVEVLASAGTHPHLPSLATDAARRAQIRLGLETYTNIFGKEPRGFWLPECSYSPSMDSLLEEFSPPLRYVVLDFTAPGSSPDEETTWEPQRLNNTPLVALMRDRRAHELVWTETGIPSHSFYREYSKRDHIGHGFQYWRVTSLETPMEEKELYDEEAARRQAHEDARSFVRIMRERRRDIESKRGEGSPPGLILAAYDTELMGHWWREGPVWLKEVLNLTAEEAVLPGEFTALLPRESLEALAPFHTSWAEEGDFTPWRNPSTLDMWREAHRAEREFISLAFSPPSEREVLRCLLQAGRELLLLQSSDWYYMISRDTASNYARQRFGSHLQRFDSLMKMAKEGEVDLPLLSSLEEMDNPFPRLSLDLWR